MSRRPATLLLAAFAVVAAGACGHHDTAAHDHDHDHADHDHGDEAAPAPSTSAAEVVRAQLATYPLETCAVSGEELGSMGTPLDEVVDKKLVRLCCKSCLKSLKAEPAKYVAMVDEAVVAAQRPTYPLDTCAVSGEELGSMGDPIDHVVGTRLVRLCCKSCVKEVDANPQAVLAKVSSPPR